MSKNYFDLSGQVAIVTGCSTGLGVQMAKALANQGAKIVALARRKEMVDAVAAEITKEFGVEAIGISCDITDTDRVNAAVDEIPAEDEEWEEPEDFPGQLAVDVYETADKLVVKARTAGISKNDLEVTINDNILTISGVLSGGEDEQTTRWHIQECYWGEFSRTIALPVQVREEGVKAELKDGVLTISFEKEKVEAPVVINVE